MNPVDIMANAFQDELEKIAMTKHAGAEQVVGKAGGKLGKYLVPMAAGAGLFEISRRANRDRKMGQAMRNQQQY